MEGVLSLIAIFLILALSGRCSDIYSRNDFPKGFSFAPSLLLISGKELLVKMAKSLASGILSFTLELNNMLHCSTTIILSIWRTTMEDGSTAESCTPGIFAYMQMFASESLGITSNSGPL
ncbi:unnamed protein product [Brassica oleracea]